MLGQILFTVYAAHLDQGPLEWPYPEESGQVESSPYSKGLVQSFSLRSSRSWLSIYQALSVSLYFSVLMYSSVQLKVHVRIKHDSILLQNWIQEPMFRQYTPLILTHSPLQLPRTAICMPVVIGYFFYLTALLGIQFCFCDYQLQTSVDSISNWIPPLREESKTPKIWLFC